MTTPDSDNRLKILTEDEIAVLFDRPVFTAAERKAFTSLNPSEMAPHTVVCDHTANQRLDSIALAHAIFAGCKQSHYSMYNGNVLHARSARNMSNDTDD